MWLLLLSTLASAHPAVGPVLLPQADHAITAPLTDFVVPEECDPEEGTLALVQVLPDRIETPNAVIPLQDMVVPAERVRGRVILDLYDALYAVAMAQQLTHEGCEPHEPFPGHQLLLAVDSRVPTGTLTDVLFTAGQAQFGDFALLVDAPDGASPSPAMPALAPAAAAPALTVLVDGGGFIVSRPGGEPTFLPCARTCSRTRHWDVRDLHTLLSGLAAQTDPNQPAALVPAFGVPLSLQAAAYDTLKTSFPGAVLASDGGPRTPVLFAEPGRAKSLVLGELVSVQRLHLPQVNPQRRDLIKAFFEQQRGLEAPPDGVPSPEAAAKRDASEPGTAVKTPSSGQMFGTPLILGSLDAAAIARVVTGDEGALRQCHQSLQVQLPELEGAMDVRFVIDSEGTVQNATVAKSPFPPDSGIATCVLARFQRMTFPKPPGSGIVMVRYPLLFQ